MRHLSAIHAISRATILEAHRGHLLWIVGLTVLVAVGLSGFMAQVAITEATQIQAAFLGAFLRWTAVFIVSLTVITSMVREFNDKGFELVLSLPLPRGGYFFGKLLGYAALAVMVAVFMTLPILFAAPVEQALFWGVSLACELLLICALSLLCMLTLKQTLPAFAVVAAFYLLSRSVSAISLMGHHPIVATDSISQSTFSAVVDGIAYMLPALDTFTATDWLVYHNASASSLLPIAGQCIVSLLFLIGAGLFDLYRKNF